MKIKVLWIGDAVSQTGFARVTHNICNGLPADLFDVNVLGVNYHGDPHKYAYDIWPPLTDVYGLERVKSLCESLKPQVVVILNDPWIVKSYLKRIPEGIPVVAYMPIDAPNQPAAKDLNTLSRAIAYTQFGRKELVLGGMNVQCDVIPHGVDTSIYYPAEKVEARRKLRFEGKKSDAELAEMFIVGNTNRNQPRKRLDLTIQYWAEWWISAGQPSNAYLRLHCSNTDQGWNVVQLADYFGIRSQLILTNPNMGPGQGMKEEELRLLYSMDDVHMTTTAGEGWGLTNHESMACGVAQLMPDYSALGEWAKDAAYFVDCTAFYVTPSRINTIGGVPDKEQMVAALHLLYKDTQHRDKLAQRALARATEPQFQWGRIAAQFGHILATVVTERHRAPLQAVK